MPDDVPLQTQLTPRKDGDRWVSISVGPCPRRMDLRQALVQRARTFAEGCIGGPARLDGYYGGGPTTNDHFDLVFIPQEGDDA